MGFTLVQLEASATDLGLLFLRVGASLVVLIIHGLPKVRHYASEAAAIEDPFHFGRKITIGFAIFAEVVCPFFVIAGFATQLAALPVVVLTAVALVRVHPEWTAQQAQFAWMLLVLFGTIAIAGAGHYTLVGMLRSWSGI
ncbi:MAG: DoxX family membrane protein [Pararobbsia sp.]